MAIPELMTADSIWRQNGLRVVGCNFVLPCTGDCASIDSRMGMD